MTDTRTFVVEVGVVHSAPSVEMANVGSRLRSRENAARVASEEIYKRIVDGIEDGRLCSLVIASKDADTDEAKIAHDYEEDFVDGYPPDWPRCPGCGKPALDGHITCGDARCDEGGRR